MYTCIHIYIYTYNIYIYTYIYNYIYTTCTTHHADSQDTKRRFVTRQPRAQRFSQDGLVANPIGARRVCKERTVASCTLEALVFGEGHQHQLGFSGWKRPWQIHENGPALLQLGGQVTQVRRLRTVVQAATHAVAGRNARDLPQPGQVEQFLQVSWLSLHLNWCDFHVRIPQHTTTNQGPRANALPVPSGEGVCKCWEFAGCLEQGACKKFHPTVVYCCTHLLHHSKHGEGLVNTMESLQSGIVLN